MGTQKEKQITGTALFDMPDQFANLSKIELLHAFASYYYELFIDRRSDREIDLLFDHIISDIQYEDYSNDVLWKKIWYSYIGYMASQVGFLSLEAFAKKEFDLANEVTREEYIEFISTASGCYRAYMNNSRSLCPSTRLFVAMQMRMPIPIIDWKPLSTNIRQQIRDKIGEQIEALVPIRQFYQSSIYFDRIQTIYDWVELYINTKRKGAPDFIGSFKHIYDLSNIDNINNIAQVLHIIIKETRDGK